ncbi:MAG: heavy metal translocating P-type ATPase [Gemmatimonadales bacterium]|nr:heavy metal translocating P-type ATPase [Gemmatimonadales bacterium]MDZ4390521.1 heavy metal translocating P-type ATPase [Gemmatimonadales bacterium]
MFGRPPSRLARLFARHEDLAWAGVAGLLLLLSWVVDWAGRGPASLPIAGYLVTGIIGGRQPVAHLLGGLRRGKLLLDIDFLMVIAAVGAWTVGAWGEGSFLLFLFALANALETYALDRARDAIRALAELAPSRARILRDGREVEIPVEQVRVGDIVVVRPAERIPADGTVQSGRSGVDQAPITGESVPVDKAPGDDVFAGTVNGEGALEIVATRGVGDRTLDRVIRLVEEAQAAKAPTQRATERFEKVLVPVVVVADFLLIVIPPLLGLMPWHESLYRGMTVLVAASPCALALGAPAAMLAGIAQAARRGVLIKGGTHLEALAGVRAIAFDKTGTLTIGRPEVTDLIPASGVSETELLEVAAAVEGRSQHPLAQAVVRRAAAAALTLPTAGDLQSVTAKGVRADLHGEPVAIGSLRLWSDDQIVIPEEITNVVKRLGEQGRSVMVVRHGERWLGVLGLADPVRQSTVTTIAELRGMGLQPLVMLTGDHAGVGDAIGREVGVDLVRADLLPENKAEVMREMIAAHGSVAMVGDGVNDAPALAVATVGIAMGGAGTAAALETADAALMGDDLSRLPFAIGLARRTRRIVRQNLVIAGGMMLILLALAAAGVLDIGPAVVGHEGSTLVVIGNALRLLGYEREKERRREGEKERDGSSSRP